MNQTPQHTHATAGTHDATPGPSDVRQLKAPCTAAESERLDRFDRAPRLLRHGATASQAGGYETGSADFENGTGTAARDGSDISVQPGLVIGGTARAVGFRCPGAETRVHSRRLGLKANQRTEEVTTGYDMTAVEYGGPTEVETLQNGTREAGLLPAEYFARISPADDGEVALRPARRSCI